MPPNTSVKGIFDLTYSTLRPENKAKVDEAKERLKKQYGNEIIDLTFEADKYSPNNEYCLKANLGMSESHSEFYDNNINKIGITVASFPLSWIVICFGSKVIS